MTDRIEPVLSASEWALAKHCYGTNEERTLALLCHRDGNWKSKEYQPILIALANAALPDSDPRKITRETVRAILAARTTYPFGSASHRELIQIAAALASYLPSDQQPAELAAAYAAYLPPERDARHE